MTYEEYAALPGINFSTLKAMADSPAHYLAAVNMERTDTPALRFGRIVDALLFTPDAFRERFAISPFDDFRTNAAKAWRAEAKESGLDVVTPDEVDEARTLADAVRAHPIARGFIDAGKFQVPMTWTDPETGLACKGLADLVNGPASPIGTFLIDGKSARTIDKRRYASAAGGYRYHCQLAHYRAGCRLALGIDPTFVGHIVYEKGAPYDVGVFEFSPETIDAGAVEVAALLQRVAECREKNEWPGRYPAIEQLELPGWVFGEGDFEPEFDDVEGA